ncbi:MAG: Fe-S cluster assembly sulfur transfer protein SufU [Mycoplasmoidaceae bacterium]
MKINNELAKELIIDHYEAPANKVEGKPKGKYLYGHNDSPSCIDNIDGYVLIEKGKVKDAKFSGIGCAICTSSTDLLVEEIIGKPVAQAKKIISNYLGMILGKKYDQKLLGKLIVYKNVNKQANRVKCAMTGIQAIEKAINSYEK